MSKTYEHYQGAAHHHERAAYQFKEAAKYHETEEHEKEAHHAYLARGMRSTHSSMRLLPPRFTLRSATRGRCQSQATLQGKPVRLSTYKQI